MAGPRRFDHEECLRLHQQGFSYAALARHFGVTQGATYQAVKRLTDPAWVERLTEYHRLWQWENRRTGACSVCGRTIWIHGQRTGKCASCAQAITVRPDSLQCGECRQWKADDEFPFQRHNEARRYRHGTCRACSAAVRQRHRESVRVPCVDCGELCSPPGTNGRHTPRDAPPRCKNCAQRQRWLRNAVP